MSELVLHPATRRALDILLKQPPHALLLVAASGAGKASLAHYVASQLLNLTLPELATYPYHKVVRASEGKVIPIDDIRAVVRFMARRTAGDTAGISRVVVIENSHLMTVQAQNALLKTIEEPPAGTILILTASDELGLLPTIRSRVQRTVVQLPDASALTKHFEANGHAKSLVDKVLLMSGGLPGLMHAMLSNDTEHPLIEASAAARSILQKTTFERLALVDDLAKDRVQALNILHIMERMAALALQPGDKDAAHLRRWHKILSACHYASEHLLANAQPKLALTNFMLSL